MASLEGNALENYLFAKDAYYIEALFIRDYLAPGKFVLSRFERYLLKSFVDDNLAEFSFLLMGFDMEMTHTIYRLNRDQKQSTHKKMAGMLEIGVNVARGLDDLEGLPPEKLYGKLVPAVTYLSCMRNTRLDVPVQMRDGQPVPDKMANQLRLDLQQEMQTIHGKLEPHLPVYVSVKRDYHQKIARL